MIRLRGITAALFAAMMVLACMTGCEGGGDDNGNPLVGTWRIVSYNGTAAPSGFSYSIKFNSDGTGTINDNGSETALTWTSTDTTITVTDPTGPDTVSYSISGDTLTLSGDGDTLVFEK